MLAYANRHYPTPSRSAAVTGASGPAVFSRTSHQKTTFFPAGSEIFAQDDVAGSLYRVEFGAVRVYRLLADGRRQISAFHLAGEIFGFEAGTTRHFFAEAICATGVGIFHPASGADVAGELLPLALQSLARAQEHLLLLGRQTAMERVAAFLTDMADRQGGLEQVELPMQRSDIGDYLGLTIETVSRVFSKLREKGIIRLPSLRSVEILKRDTLHRMSE